LFLGFLEDISGFLQENNLSILKVKYGFSGPFLQQT